MRATCSVVIPVFNHAALTAQCLEALFEDPPRAATMDVVVVDDGSTDSTPTLLVGYGERIRVVTRSTNGGFARACNDGARVSTGDHLVFLNNDTIPEPGWLDALVRYAGAHPQAAVVGSKLLYPDGTVQHAGVVVCANRGMRHLYAGFPAEHPAVNRSRRFQAVTAACSLVRRAAFERVGGFDTGYVNGYEDVDLCLRLGELGHEVHYCHESVLRHLESVSRGSRLSAHNTTLYLSRWADRVEPDDLEHYLEDGVLAVEYGLRYPATLHVAPELATIASWERTNAVDELVRQAVQRAQRLLDENIRLTARLREAELSQRAARPDPGLGAEPREASEPELIVEGRVLPSSAGPSRRLVSVVIPVRNGGRWLRTLLARLERQPRSDDLEVVAIDSGSVDDGVGILRDFGATVLAIEPGSFNHALTRMIGASRARGEILVFLNQDALPANQSWLRNLIAPFQNDERIVGVCSRVLPAENADLLTLREGMRDPNASGERQVRAVQDQDAYRGLGPDALRLFINFHTISAAIRADALARIPFRAVARIGEDIQWAKDVLEAGLKIQHEPSSIVLHSHDYTHAELFLRHLDDGIANREIVGRRLAPSELGPLILTAVRDDWWYLEHDCKLPPEELERWRQESAVRRAIALIGQWLGQSPESIRALLPAERRAPSPGGEA